MVLYIAMMLQQVGDGRIQVSRLLLRARHFMIIVYRSATKFAHEINEPILGTAQSADQNIRHHNGSCIDERVARFAMLIFQLHERVEGIATGFLSHTLPQFIAFQTQTHGQHKHL